MSLIWESSQDRYKLQLTKHGRHYTACYSITVAVYSLVLFIIWCYIQDSKLSSEKRYFYRSFLNLRLKLW
jgi:hypothetical protein